MKSLILFVSSLIFVCINALQVQAQDAIDTTIVIQSKAFGKERTIRVHLPRRYQRNAEEQFMTTYVLDAQSDNYWNMAKSNIGYLVNNYQVLPMIAVGIVTEDRQNEFIPLPKYEAKRNNKGTAHLLQQHIREEIIPLIDRLYRVDDMRAIVGHSRGGAFISHTLFSDQSDLFSGYIGISPAMGYLKNQILNDADAVLQARSSFKKYLYCSHGDVGANEEAFGGHVAHLDSLIRKYPNETLAWEHETIENTDHWTCVIPSWNDGLMRMSRNYWVDQKTLEGFVKNKGQSLQTQMDAFYAEVDKKFGYSYHSSLPYLRFVGNDFDEMGQLDAALEIFGMALKLDPENIGLHRNKAWIYRQKKAWPEAKALYEKALGIIEKNKAEMDAEDYKGEKEDIEDNIQKVVDEMGK